MTKEDFNAWLEQKCQTQKKLILGAMAAMAAIGLIAFLIQFGLFYVILWALYDGHLIPFFITAGGLAAMSFFTVVAAPKTLRDQVYEVEVGDHETDVAIAPTMSSAWTFAMGSRDSDISIPERIFGAAMIVPRMFWTAWYLNQRRLDVEKVDARECGAILRFALKKAEKVDVAEILHKRPKTDLSRTLRECSLIDGVVFLVRDGLGMTLANRFKEAVETEVPKVAAARASMAAAEDH